MSAFMLKAAREAKRQTGWTRRDVAYEARLAALSQRTLADTDFRAAFEERARPFIEAGARKSLVQLALKLTLPGVPDIYQGTEWADLSLVDPDNRPPVDFAARRSALGDFAPPAEAFADAKLTLMRRLLALRADLADLFAHGDCPPLLPSPGGAGRHLGIARSHRGALVVLLAELSPPRKRRDVCPRFALPEAWRGAFFTPVWPDTRLSQDNSGLAPLDGFAAAPVLVALARRPA